ncbi:hypothetical protein ACK8P5_12870 [Paenibacillus sp. EC2-1]
MVPLKVANSGFFFVLTVQVLVPSPRQELGPIAVEDKNIFRLPTVIP